MDEFPWIYVAMIFIAFISWLRARIKAAAERRREIAESRRRSSNREAPVAHQSPYRDSPVEAASQDTSESFERMVERMIGIPITEEEEEPAKAPPPLPPKRKPVKEAAKGKLANDAGSFEVEEPELRIPKKGSFLGGRPTRSRSASTFIRSLKSKSQVRNAIILREVLDKPKGLS